MTDELLVTFIVVIKNDCLLLEQLRSSKSKRRYSL